MKWISVSIDTLVSAEDLVSSAVHACGITGVQIENSLPPTDKEMKAMFNDDLPELMPEGLDADDPGSRVIFYLRVQDSGDRTPDELGGIKDDSYAINDRIYSEQEVREILNEVRSRIGSLREHNDIGSGAMSFSTTSDSDWIDNWKQYYEPVVIGDILILPEWMDVPEDYTQSVKDGLLNVIKLNPGTAFGTGSHETTKLAIEGLLRYMKQGDRLLDIGTGSGIIGLCALAKGASHVTATEIDSGCVPSVMHNLEINGIKSGQFDLAITNVLDPEGGFSPGTFPIITANILAPVIEALAAPGAADRFTEHGGIFVTSGLAAAREQEVLDAFSANPSWKVTDVLRMNDWISVIARKVL